MLNGTMLYSLIFDFEAGNISEAELELQFLRSNIDITIFYAKDDLSGKEQPDFYTLRPCGYQAVGMGDTNKKTLSIAWCVCANPDEVMKLTLDAWLIGLGIFEE